MQNLLLAVIRTYSNGTCGAEEKTLETLEGVS